MLEDPTVVHSFAALGGASTLFVILQLARGVVRLINSKRADTVQEQRNATAEYQDLKEAVQQLSEQAERLKVLVQPVTPIQVPAPPAGVAWASTPNLGNETSLSHG